MARSRISKTVFFMKLIWSSGNESLHSVSQRVISGFTTSPNFQAVITQKP